MTEKQLTEILKSAPRERTWEEVETAIIQLDHERGEYVANQIVHHNYGESAR